VLDSLETSLTNAQTLSTRSARYALRASLVSISACQHAACGGSQQFSRIVAGRPEQERFFESALQE